MAVENSAASPATSLMKAPGASGIAARSEEHTSELQSLRHLVCRLLLEKKKEKTPRMTMAQHAAALWMKIFNATTLEMARVHEPLVAGLDTGKLRPVHRRWPELAGAERA